MAAEVWEVVGGFDKGGILVREGGDSTSKQCEERLAFGALVKKVELRDVKLHYQLLLGDGPIEGWVSTKITGKSLVTRCLDVSKVRKALEAPPPQPKTPAEAPAAAPAAALAAAPAAAPAAEEAPAPAREPAPEQQQPPAEAAAPAPVEAPPPTEGPAPAAAAAETPAAAKPAAAPAEADAPARQAAAAPEAPPFAPPQREAPPQEPERRMAEDGVYYTQPEFRECYGSDAEWESRAEIGFAGFEGFVDEAAGGHSSTETMTLVAAKARCMADRGLAGFCYDTVGGTIPADGELTVHFKTSFEMTPAPGSGWWAWKAGWPKLPAPRTAVEEQPAAPAAGPGPAAASPEAAAPPWPPPAELAARISERCAAQKAQPIVWWNWIESETVKAGCNRVAAGLFYELTFPWTREKLLEKGPEWLTRAFHAAGTLDRENKVIELRVQDKCLFISDSADQIFFEVAYEKDDPTLHTQLVAKVPLPLDGETYRDRLVSSYYKQPWDMYEINAHRLFESELPMRTPRFYFGDISNETSNYILVVEQLPFAGFSGDGAAAAPKAGEIEGPYAACRDDQLRRPAKEYYLAIMRMHAALAAKHQKCQELLQSGLMSAEADSLEDPEAWGVEPGKPTFEDLQIVLRRLEAGISFFAGTAKAIFPPYVGTEAFQAKLRLTMTNLQAYHSEINYWKHKDPRYVALVHGNLSVDNAFFWTGEGGKLEAGVRDCSGLGVFSVPHRIWWSLACADFENVHANLDEYIDTFVTLYREEGGPAVDRAVVRRTILLTAVDSLMLMVNAVPKCLRLCPAEEWSTIQGLDDPRLAGAGGGRGFVRRTVQVLRNGLRVVEEMDGPQVLDSWIREVYVQEWGETPKSIATEE